MLCKTMKGVGVRMRGRETVHLTGLDIVSIYSEDVVERPAFLRVPGAPVLTRFRLLMTSVLREMGRGRPCSFRKRPQALHRTEPDSSRRQRGVVLVAQFWQTGWERSVGGWTGIIDCDKVIRQTTCAWEHAARRTAFAAAAAAARSAYGRVCISTSGGGRGGCVGHAVARESAQRSGQRDVEMKSSRRRQGR